MYRIYFEPKLGRFLIQVLVFGCFWKTVRQIDDKPDGFVKFADATAYIKDIGLDKLYKDKSANRYWDYVKQNQLQDSYER